MMISDVALGHPVHRLRDKGTNQNKKPKLCRLGEDAIARS